jgi:23S rRNA (adenine2503-C2)-methyltransferase
MLIASELIESNLHTIGESQPISLKGEHTGTVDFFNLSFEALSELMLSEFAEPSYRATQLFEWVYRRRIYDIDAMSNIASSLRKKLVNYFSFPKAAIRSREISNDGTRKYLLEVEKGDLVEAVMIKQPSRMTLCISSQVGCAMACAFCRTGTMGLKRHLSTSEIIRQVNTVIEDAQNFADNFTNIVFMGMGEPLHNFAGVSAALKILTHKRAFNLGPRKITVSTSGLVPAIEKFASENLPANLAVSLNATTDEVRTKIMPVNKAYPIEKLIATLRKFPLRPRGMITMEYVMLAGVNDSDDDLKRLPKLLKGLSAKVNLIPYNSNADLGFTCPDKDKILSWNEKLNAMGVSSTIRWSKGADIKAACGQLATVSIRQSQYKTKPV